MFSLPNNLWGMGCSSKNGPGQVEFFQNKGDPGDVLLPYPDPPAAVS